MNDQSNVEQENNNQNSPWEGQIAVEPETSSESNSPQGNYTNGFGIFSAIGDSFRVLKGNFFTFFILMLIPQVLFILIAPDPVIAPPINENDPSLVEIEKLAQDIEFSLAQLDQSLTSLWVDLLVSSLTPIFIVPAIIFGSLCYMEGQKASIGAMIGRAFSLSPKTFGALLIAGIVTLIGFILLIIPGVIALLMFFPLVAIIVWEDAGVFKSLDRAKNLTSGYKMPIFGMFMILIIIGSILVFLVMLFAVSIFDLSATSTAMISTVITGSLVSAYSACLTAVVYKQLVNENG